MAEDNATTKLTFDATGAKTGADQFKAAADQVILSNVAVEAAENKASQTVEAAATKRTAVRRAAAQAARDAAQIESAAAIAGADAVTVSTNRVLTGMASQVAMLDRYAKSWDPFIGAAQRAQVQLEQLMRVASNGTEESARAASMIPEAVNRLNAAQSNLSIGSNAGATLDQLTAKFAPAQASAQRMTAELRQLNQAYELGISIEGGYAAAQDRIISAHDGTAAAALTAKAATEQAAAENARLAASYDPIKTASLAYAASLSAIDDAVKRNIINEAQAAVQRDRITKEFSDQMGTGAALGVDPAQQIAATEKLAAENAKLAASYNPIKTASLAYEAELQGIDTALSRNIINEQQAAVQRDRVTRSFSDQMGTAKALGLATDEMSGSIKGAAASHAQMQFAARQAQVQTMQFISSIASGQPIWMAFIQQGHQMADVAAATGTGFNALGMAASRAWALLISPTGIAVASVAAVTGAVVALSVAAENTDRRIGALRNSISLVKPGDFASVADQAERVARALARTTPIGITDARSGASVLASANSAFSGTDASAQFTISLFAKLSTALGETAPNFTRLAEAMKAPSAVLQEMANKDIAGVTQGLVNQVKEMERAGNMVQPWTILLTSMGNATKRVTDNQTELQAALIRVQNAFATGSQNGKSFAQVLGSDINSNLALVITGFARFIELLNSIPKDVMGGIAAAFLQIVPVLGPLNNAISGIRSLYEKGNSTLGAAGLPTIPGLPGATQGSTPTQGYDINVATAVVAGLVAKGVPQLDAIALAAMNVAETGGRFNGPVGDINIPAGIDPTYGAYPGGSHGGFQWNRGRLANFMSQNAGQLPEQTSMDTQLAFVVNELTTTHKAVADAAREAQDLSTKTAIYTGKYEVPADVQRQIAARTATALDIQTRMAAGAPGATTTPVQTAATAAAPNQTAIDAAAKSFTQSTAEQTKRLEELRQQFDPTANSLRGLGADFEFLSKLVKNNGQIVNDGKVVYQASKDELEQYKRTLLNVAGTLDNTRTPQEAFQHDLELQANLTQQVTEGDQRRAAMLQQLHEIQLKNPGTRGAQDEADALGALTKAQEGQLRQAEYGLDRQIIGNKELATATLQGGAAVQKATAQLQAFAEASKLFGSGPERDAAFARLSDDYLKVAQSAAALQVAQQIKGNNDQIEMIQAETSALGSNDEARVKMLANLKTEQYLKNQGIPLESQYGQALLASSAAATQLGYTLQQQKAGVDAFASAFSQSFDTIGNAMAQSFMQGSGAAVNWKNVMTTVIQQVIQQMLKLSVLNPITNWLFGQNAPTIDSGVKGLAAGTGPLSGIARALLGSSGAASGVADVAAFAAQDASSAIFMDTASAFIHSGGIAGIDGTIGYVHPAYFDDAPRYHVGVGNADIANSLGKMNPMLTGGERRGLDLGHDEVAAILLKNERVLTVDQTKSFDKMVRSFGAIQAALHHSGGLAGRMIETREVNPGIFVGAPRFHDGVGGDSISALLDNFNSMGSVMPSAGSGGEGARSEAPIIVNLHLAQGQSPDQFRSSGPQVARHIGRAIRTEMSRGRI